MLHYIATLWREPPAPDPLGPISRDWKLVAIFILIAIGEGVLSEQIAWRIPTIIMTVCQTLTLPWRRVRPLLAVVIVFGSSIAFQISATLTGVDWTGLESSFFPLILVYTLARWGAGYQIVIGLAVIFASVFYTVVATVAGYTWIEFLAATVFMLFPIALGVSVRYLDSAERHAKEQVRMIEREQLARELHDTVAHHVSAIAIQAQAGQAQAALRPEAPLEALKTIEKEASRTLTEMRLIVSALREDESAERSPAATLADIQLLAQNDQNSLRIDVTMNGQLDDIDSTLASTLFRLAQESVTNARRHASEAEAVAIHITGDEQAVHLSVIDDGKMITQTSTNGRGLQGMNERVSLLGGSLTAGPGENRGWSVRATLPKFTD